MSLQKIIIFTAASGSGKTSLVRHLLNRFPEKFDFSISCATRQKRNNEIDGKDYYFIKADDFKEKIKQNAFAEWEMVYEGKYYGTLKSELERIWKENKTPILDIDVQGAINVQKQYPQQTLSVFIEPPSIGELKKRLEARGTETPESIKVRIAKAADEILYKNQFSVSIINDDLEVACKEAEELACNFLKS